MAPDTLAMLDRFGPIEGWARLDIGPGGITDLLSGRVGAVGRVIGLDMDEEFLEYARRSAPNNVVFRCGNAYDSDLPSGSFDLVFRFGEVARSMSALHRIDWVIGRPAYGIAEDFGCS
jgi:ubiquinone/menaquinone biosynthesis C-methylase UbiE